MSTAEAITKPITTEALFELPDDGVHREIIRGELRERPMTMRNTVHSGLEAKIARILGNWLADQPAPRGRIHSGEAGFRLKRNPDTSVGIDVAYASADLVRSHDPEHRFYDGAPVLAVEIVSPSDQQKDIVEKVGLYLEVGTVVWVVDPDFRAIRVHREGQRLVVLTDADELSGEDYLPGLRVPVASLFED